MDVVDVWKSRKENSNVKSRQFWQQNNKPIEIWSFKVFEQKLNYIHNTPLETGFVTNPVDWKYSSARNYGDNDQTVLEIDINWLFCVGTSETLAPTGVIKDLLGEDFINELRKSIVNDINFDADKIDFAIIKEGGPYDLEPFLNFKY